MLLTAFWFLLSAGAIYVACEYFVNGVEWLGRRLNLSSTATGTVLAAFGTALPESVVTFVAVVLGNTPQQRDIGVGAALGGPLVLATVAYGVVGLALLSNRRKLGRADHSVHVDHRRLSQDQVWFMAIFVVKVALGLVAFAFKPWLGLLFLAAYGFYVWRELKDERTDVEEELEPLKFRPTQTEPSLAWAAAQTLVALCVVAYASHVFVVQVEALATGFHLSPHLAALLLSPVATEMPETMNALIWVRQGRERLALANISGAMMIQATIPSALGIFFTPWMFDTPLIAAAVVTLLAVIGLWAAFRSGRVGSRLLASVAGLYLAFCGFVLWSFR